MRKSIHSAVHPIFAAVTLTAVMLAAPVAANATSASEQLFEGRWFSALSPWNTAIPANRQTTSAAAQWIAAAETVGPKVTYNLDMWTPAVIDAPAGTPGMVVPFTSSWRLADFPIDADVLSATAYFESKHDTDSSLCVYSEDREEFFNTWNTYLINDNTMIQIGAGAIFPVGGAGWWNDSIGPWPGRASGASYCGGLIRPQELASGTINHALAAGWAHQLIRSSSIAHAVYFPATSTDGGGTNSNTAIPMGARLQLDPTLTDTALAAMGLTTKDIVIAHAMQTYGIYVVDSSSGFCLYFQSGLGNGKNLYPGLGNGMPEALMNHLTVVQVPTQQMPLDSRLTVPGVVEQ